MLSLIHGTMFGQGPAHFKQWFYRENLEQRRTLRFKRHRFRLYKYIDGKQIAVVKRSVLGLVSVYSMLPTEIVEATTVKSFQQLLQDLANDCACRSHPHWDSLYSMRHKLHIHPIREFSS